MLVFFEKVEMIVFEKAELHWTYASFETVELHLKFENIIAQFQGEF